MTRIKSLTVEVSAGAVSVTIIRPSGIPALARDWTRASVEPGPGL